MTWRDAALLWMILHIIVGARTFVSIFVATDTWDVQRNVLLTLYCATNSIIVFRSGS